MGMGLSSQFKEFNCFITLYGKTLGRFPVQDNKWKLKEK